jgi:hypothetical protein
MKDLRKATENEINDFERLATDIFDFLNKHWDIEVKPKKYDKYLENFEEFEDMDNMGKYEKDFKGFKPACDGLSLPETLSLPNTAYSDVHQSRTPLQTLIGAILSYGLKIGNRRKEIDKLDIDNITKLIEKITKIETVKK